MQEIAAVAGVHQTTVSLALRNRPTLPLATRQRIQAVALKLGYRPDPVLAALRAHRRSSPASPAGDTSGVAPIRRGFSLAFVTSGDTAAAWKRAASYVRNREGIGDRARELGYQVEDFWFDRSSMSGRRATQILRARNISGLIIVPLPVPASLDFDWRHFASVSLTFSLLNPSLHTICNHHWDTVQLACHRLDALGYRRIGLVLNGNSNTRVQRIWSGGVLDHASRLPARQRVPPLMPEQLDPAIFRRWLRRFRPDAILTIPPHLARVREWMDAEKVDVPGDVGLATLDCADRNDRTSGVYQEPEIVGRTAVDVIAGLIQRNDLGLPDHPHSTFIRGSWVDGQTTRQHLP